MTDTIIKGTGNSRSIKAATSIPATWEEFRAQLISAGIPIDIGALNALGCQVAGTPLDAAHIFEYAMGNYVGTGKSGVNYKTTITLSFAPKFVVVVTSHANRSYWTIPLVLIRPASYANTYFNFGGLTFDNVNVEWGEKTVSFYYDSPSDTIPQPQLNIANVPYYYVAFG